MADERCGRHAMWVNSRRYMLIAAVVFIGVIQFTLHLPSMAIGARDFLVGFFSIAPYSILSYLHTNIYLHFEC
jgi:hypothetical protein